MDGNWVLLKILDTIEENKFWSHLINFYQIWRRFNIIFTEIEKSEILLDAPLYFAALKTQNGKTYVVNAYFIL